MRCSACDRILTEFEMVMRGPESGVFVDLCGLCYNIAYDLEDREDKQEDTLAIVRGEITHEQDW